MTRRPPILTTPTTKGIGGHAIPECTSPACADQQERLHTANLRLAVEAARADHRSQLLERACRDALRLLAGHDPAGAARIRGRLRRDLAHRLTTRQALQAVTRKGRP